MEELPFRLNWGAYNESCWFGEAAVGAAGQFPALRVSRDCGESCRMLPIGRSLQKKTPNNPSHAATLHASKCQQLQL